MSKTPLESLGVSVVFPLRSESHAEERDTLCEVLELCTRNKLCPMELVLITDLPELKNEIIPTGQTSKALQSVLLKLEPLDVDLKVVKITKIDRKKFISTAIRASSGFAFCTPAIDVRGIKGNWCVYPLGKLLEDEDAIAKVLLIDHVYSHPYLFLHGFVSTSCLYKREALLKQLIAGDMDEYDKYMKKALVFGSLDMDEYNTYRWAFVFVQRGFCSALMALEMLTRKEGEIFRALQESPMNQEYFLLGKWNLPNTNMENIDFFYADDLPHCTTQCPDNNILIATSIAPKRIEDQQEAIETWFLQGFDVVSINYPDEIAKLKEHFPKVRFVETKQDSTNELGKKRVYVDDVLDVLREEGKDYKAVGIVNSDVGLYHVSPNRIIESCAKGLLFSHRVDIPSKDILVYGYDAFFFSLDAIQTEARIGSYFLGEPWWDVLFPLYVLRNGKESIQAHPPLCYHKEHEQQWDFDSFDERGIIFSRYLCEGLSELKPHGLSMQGDFTVNQHRDHLVWFQRLVFYWYRHLPTSNALEGYAPQNNN